MKYIVTVTLKSPSSDPVHLVWYKGSSHTKAIAAMVSATTQDVADSEMPESIRTQMLSVTMTFEEEEALPSDYCDQSGAAPGEDNSTHHMMCLYCGKTEKQIREEKPVMTYHFPIKVGDRVALAPHLDLWMRGARFGKCVKVSTNIEGDTIYWIAPDGPTHRVWLSADDLLGAVRITSTTPMTPEAGSVLSPIEDDEDDDDPGI